jgi:NADH-quinone oxidoreductase subunit G
LNDLVRELIGAPKETIDWTVKLPVDQGYRAVAFDDLSNSYSNDGSDNRGYSLVITEQESALPDVEKPESYSALEGEVVCRCNPGRQFSDFSDKAHQIFEPFALYVSPSKAEKLGERVEVVFKNRTLTLDVVTDEKIEGEIMCIPDFKSAKDIYGLFGNSRYQTVTIRKG